MARQQSTKIAASEAEEQAAPTEEVLDLYPTASQAADYIAQMALSLRGLARARDLHFLGYLLSLAFEEAREVASRQAGTADRGEGAAAP
jgi:hypothetical protein